MKRGVNKFKSIIGVCILALIVINVQAQAPKKRLLVFDRLVSNYQALASQKTISDDVLVLSESGNPLEAIANALKKASFDEIHIYALTKPGSIIFDEVALTSENVIDYKSLFELWKGLIKPGATIIVHSTSLTTVPEGEQLVSNIKDYTGTEVKVLE